MLSAIVAKLKRADYFKVANFDTNVANLKFFYDSMVAENPLVGTLLMEAKPRIIKEVFEAYIDHDSKRYLKYIADLSVPHEVDIILKTLSDGNVAPPATRNELIFHLKEALKDDSLCCTGHLLSLVEEPYALLQALDSLLTCKDEKLKHYLLIFEEAYCA